MTLKNIITALSISIALPLYGGDGGGLLPSDGGVGGGPGVGGGLSWTLEQCINHAIANNIKVKRQQLTVESEKISVNTSRSSRLPGVNASASQSFNFGRGLTANNTYANRNTMNTSMDMSASMTLYSGGQISRDIEVRQLNLQTAIAELDRVKDDIEVQVMSAYMEALYQQRLVEIAQHQLALSRTQAQRIKALVDNGKRAEADYAEALSTIANDELTLVQNENSLQLAILNLTQLLELPQPEGFALASLTFEDAHTVLIPNANDIYGQAVNCRPSIQAEMLRLNTADRNIALARTGYLPTVSVGAGLSSGYYKTSGFDAQNFSRQLSDNFNKYVGLQLNIPVFNRFSTRNQIRQAKVQYMAQQLQLDETKKNLYKEIQQAYYNATGAQRQCITSASAEQAAEAAYNLVEGKYLNGKATATEYEEAKTRLIRSQCDHAQAQCNFHFRKLLLEHYAKY